MCPKNYVYHQDVYDCIVETVKNTPWSGIDYIDIYAAVTCNTYSQFDRQFKKALRSGEIFEIQFKKKDGSYCARYHHNSKIYIKRVA